MPHFLVAQSHQREILTILAIVLTTSPAVAQPINLVFNSGFDVDLSGWTTVGVLWSPEDANGDPNSGSALLESDLRIMQQCVEVEALDYYVQKVKLRYATQPEEDDGVLLRTFWYDDATCNVSGGSLGVSATLIRLEDMAWHELNALRQAPPGAIRGLVQILGGSTTSNPMIHVDDARLDAGELLFFDGFESGDTSAW